MLLQTDSEAEADMDTWQTNTDHILRSKIFFPTSVHNKEH